MRKNKLAWSEHTAYIWNDNKKSRLLIVAMQQGEISSEPVAGMMLEWWRLGLSWTYAANPF